MGEVESKPVSGDATPDMEKDKARSRLGKPYDISCCFKFSLFSFVSLPSGTCTLN